MSMVSLSATKQQSRIPGLLLSLLKSHKETRLLLNDCKAKCQDGQDHYYCQEAELWSQDIDECQACIEAQTLYRSPAHTYSMHGGAGALISVGLLRKVSWEAISRCVNNQWSSGKLGSASESIWANIIPHQALGSSIVETRMPREYVRFDDM